MANSRPTLLATLGQIFCRLLEMHGLDVAAIGREAGVDFTRVPAPLERIDANRAESLLRTAAELIRNDSFGLLAARCWHPSNLGVLGHGWLASSTLRTALGRLERFWALIGEGSSTVLQEARAGLKVVHRRVGGDPVAASIAVDIAMSVILDMCRMNAGAALRPVAVTLQRKRPSAVQAYEQFYGCPVQFGKEANSFVLLRADVDRALPSSNRQLAAVFDRLLAEEIGRPGGRDVVARCKAVLLEQLASGALAEEDMAHRLQMHRFALRRSLEQAGTTYRALVDDVRRDLALRYIAEPRRSIADITFVLGFPRTSAFVLAFRRWTGRTPEQHRAR